MKDYLEIANSGYFYMWGSVILLVIAVQAILFIRLAWKEGKRIGLNPSRMLKGLRAGMVSAIIPSIPIVIALIAMSGMLGIPFPWIRLSVIGSAPYELLASGIGAKSMGVETLSATGVPLLFFANSVWGMISNVMVLNVTVSFTTHVFANSVWVMTIGAMWSGLMVFFFLKTIKKQYQKIEKKDPNWMKVITTAAFFGVICIFLVGKAVTGTIPLLTTFTGAILMTICALLITKLKIHWLREFALPISMIGAMAGAVLFTQMLVK